MRKKLLAGCVLLGFAMAPAQGGEFKELLKECLRASKEATDDAACKKVAAYKISTPQDVKDWYSMTGKLRKAGIMTFDWFYKGFDVDVNKKELIPA